MEELVVVEVVGTQGEAELLCSLLQNEGIRATYRVSNFGAGAGDGLAVGGPQEVIVRSADLESARTILAQR
jgi:hypothetical protein